jgi:cytochrome c
MLMDFSTLFLRRLLRIWILGLFICICLPAGASELIDWSRFERVSVARDLVQPMEFEIAPDGTVFLIELGGKLKRIDPVAGDPHIVAELSVTTAQENGLIGLALAPDFQGTGWIYLQYSPPDFSGQRISRFWYADGKLDLDSEQRLLQFEEQRRECCHHAGGMEFGPDGCLYIATGDNTNPFEDSEGYAPLDERDGREPWDAQRSSGNTRSFNGKILRIRPEPDGTYSIPEGNLFPPDGSVGLPEIYVMGCRNPWRISVDPRTGYLYWGDVGPDAGKDGPRGPRGYDEINQARRAGNFGWPYFIADNQAYFAYDFETKEVGSAFNPSSPANRSRNNTGAIDLPPAQPALIYYPSAPFQKFPELGFGGRTACAGPINYADTYASSPDVASAKEFRNRLPEAFDRCLFIFEWSRNWIKAVHLDEQSQPTLIEPFWPEQKFTRPIQIKLDAFGRMFVLLYGETWGVNPDAELIRIDYIRGNRTPLAVLQADRTSGREPLSVNLSAAESSDRDGDPLEYLWSYSPVRSESNQSTGSLEPTSETVIGIDQDLNWIFEEPGIYAVHLDVWDPEGAVSRTSTTVVVGNDPPQVRFLSPENGSFFEPGLPVEYELEVVDTEDGTNNSQLALELDLDELEPESVQRTAVQFVPVDLSGQFIDQNAAPPGLRLIRQSGCLNCHAEQRPLVGPSFSEVATKYRDQPEAMERSVQRVLSGSTGVWGKVPMLPHSQIAVEDLQKMVAYVYSVTPGQNDSMTIGFRNQLVIPADAQCIRLEATFTDAGNGAIPALTSTASLVLRSRKIQAEAAIEYRRTKPLASDNAEGGQFMGSIDHRGFLKFPELRLDQVGAIRVSVASAGAGGQIEFRVGSPKGEPIGVVSVEVNGQWEEFYQKMIPIEAVSGSHDVYAVFVNEKNRGGLMNIDWVEFLPRDVDLNSIKLNQ